MTRGNQRDVNRERARQRRERVAPKGKREYGMDYLKKSMLDAEVMREKQKQADLRRQEEEAAKRVEESKKNASKGKAQAVAQPSGSA